MNYQDFIGFEIDKVKQIMMENNINFEIVETKNDKKDFDTILVTNIKINKDKVLLITDKFLLYI